MATIDVAAVKKASEKLILEHGGRVCDWLPSPDPKRKPRTLDEVVRRALILNALFQIAMEAPIPIIRGWIEENGLSGDLSPWEKAVLKKNSKPTKRDKVQLYWYVEALWAMAWVGGLIEDLPFNEPVGDNLASLCPDLQQNEDGTKFRKRMKLRSHGELFRMLDLYYRVHWWTRDAGLKGEETGAVSMDWVVERRKVLEWVLDADAAWDDVELST